MTKARLWRGRRMAATGLLGMLALAAGATGAGCDSDKSAEQCVSAREYFAEVAWPTVIGKVCIACHSNSGIANTTDYVLKGSAEPDFIDYDMAVLERISALERDGTSILLLKPTLQVAHKGGRVVQLDSAEYEVLSTLVDHFENGEQCEPVVTNPFARVELAGPVETLRKAAIILAGRLPTADEVALVRDGGMNALGQALDGLMTEEHFYDFLKTTYNDYLHTDFYLSQGASDVINDSVYVDPYWFQAADKTLLEKYGLQDSYELRRFTDWGIAREPLELIAHVVRQNRPFTEVVTADYMMVTPLSARTFGVAATAEFQNPDNPLEWAEARLTLPDGGAFPHAGILTSPMFLSRHTTTDTNRNRHRVREVLYFAFGLDILKVAQQAVDPSALLGAINPTRDEPACFVCHKVMDPMAAAFMSWGPRGDYDPAMSWSIDGSEKWYPENFAPGFNDELMPESELWRGTQWLAERIAADERFRIGATYMIYEGLTGRRPVTAPNDLGDPNYQQLFRSFMTQADTLRLIANNFAESGFDLRVLVKELVLSPYFRARDALPLDPEQEASLAEVGMGHLLTPEQLHHKIAAVLGLPWSEGPQRPNLDFFPREPGRDGNYLLFYGGQDSVQSTRRTREATGLMAAVADRMGNEMACAAVPQDFVRSPEERVLFPLVDVGGTPQDLRDLAPYTDNDLPVDGAIAAIKTGIARLHERVLGEPANADEIEATYALFLQVWRDGRAAMDPSSPTPLSTDLPYQCRALRDFYTGVEYPDDLQIQSDETYVLRAWMAVVSYYLGDYKFLYE
ncbi:MAG: hypothetical protein IT373_08600 [Polyangiaceae bacterium]|nr:hypothetical protein [Polyangiaceae bacterium]